MRKSDLFSLYVEFTTSFSDFAMAATAVQFGAGNIGRGFMAQLFHESGLEVVFVDVADRLVEALNSRHSYRIEIVGPGAAVVPITRVRAVDGRDQEAVTREIAGCMVACTAVGAGALEHIAPNLAAGLRLRNSLGGEPLNILICENLHDAADRLRELVAAHLPDEFLATILAQTGFVQAVVSRMVPLQESPSDDPLAIRVEAYKRLPIDASAIRGKLPPIVGVEPVSNFEAHVGRKLYTHNCAHATLGYLGWQRGIEYGWQALEDPAIRRTLQEVLEETGEALIRKHGFDPVEYVAHIQDLLARFANRDLGDTCFRLAKDPIRKLAPDDRLVGAARLCESQGIEPRALATVIAAALRFDSSDDPSAQDLQRQITQAGLESALSEVCNIESDEPLGQAIRHFYGVDAHE